MKNAIYLFLVLGGILFTACQSEKENSVKDESEPTQVSTSKQVTAIHEFELKDDIDAEEFETLVLTKIAPIYNQMRGQQFSLVKGDRGNRLNKYAIILTFDSIDDRNRIYPEKGESTEDWREDDEVWEKLTSMTDGLWMHHTDYVRISQ